MISVPSALLALLSFPLAAGPLPTLQTAEESNSRAFSGRGH